MKQQQLKSSKREQSLRWVILVFAIFSSFGVEFSFDNPAMVKDLLYRHFKNKYTSEEFEISYSLMYSCLAIPNIIVPFIVGYLIDKIGVRSLYTMLAIFSVIGQSLVSYGIQTLCFTTIYSGRMVLGMACESMANVQGIFLNQYFKRNQMSFVVGGIYCLANFGGIFNAYFTPRIAVNYNLPCAFWLGSFFCAVICLMTFVAICLDKKLENSMIKAQEDSESLEVSVSNRTEAFDDQEPLLDAPDIDEPTDEHASKTSSFAEIKSFPSLFWYICFGTALIQASILSFNVIGASYIRSKWFRRENVKRASEDSGAVFSMFRLSSFIFSPLLGYVVDKTGDRSSFFILGCGLTLISHIMVITLKPLVPCVLFGMAFSLIYTVCWPSVMLLVKKENVGKACGLITSLENVGLALLPLIDGILKNTFGSYDDSQIFLAVLSFFGLILGIKAYHVNHKQEKIQKNKEEKAV